MEADRLYQKLHSSCDTLRYGKIQSLGTSVHRALSITGGLCFFYWTLILFSVQFGLGAKVSVTPGSFLVTLGGLCDTRNKTRSPTSKHVLQPFKPAVFV